MRDTQALKYNEGCTYNTLLLTQKVGERLEADTKTFICFIDLLKAFVTVKKRLLWARLRNLGVKRKPFRALRAGYGARRLIGKIGSNLSEPYRDIGLEVRQGEIDSADAFAAFIDDLDIEIERAEEKLGRKLGIPSVGNREREKDTLTALKHADDTCIMGTTEEDSRYFLIS